MMIDFFVCGLITFFHVRQVSDQEEISCGRLCFREME